MSRFDLPLSRPHFTGNERAYLEQALVQGHLCGDGAFTARCERAIEAATGAGRALLMHSCTAALEAAMLLIDLAPGDEVIMPSFTFSSTANAVALRGGVPVFVDVRADTLNLDETLIEAAIGPKTRAILPVHYAGVACAMDEICAIARRQNLIVVEDAAQAVGATWQGRALGTIGDIGALSFHVTKNIISGEGGALLVADPDFVRHAEIIREKGTDRAQLLRGEVNRYEWQTLGSSYLPGEMTAAFLLAQLEQIDAITARKLMIWDSLHAALLPLEQRGLLQRPTIPAGCGHNGHIYYILINDPDDRIRVRDAIAAQRVQALPHYEPLHASPAGRRHGRPGSDLAVTERSAARLLRLPIWPDMTPTDAARVAAAVADALVD
jgi:dTDP-4-amino-4,6-dideoxygalactose transaminase